MSEEFVPLKVLAAQMGISYYALHYHVAKGRLKTKKDGARHFVRKSDVDKLMEKWGRPRKKKELAEIIV